MNPCRTCGKCCYNTEMLLSLKDIQMIESENKNHLKKEDFCVLQNNDYVLKNLDGHCIFFNRENNFCTIYEIRPQGCRFYPLIFNEEKNQCILDDDCPSKHTFYRHKPELQAKCKQLRKWIHENFSN